jgi:hypothetical protein
VVLKGSRKYLRRWSENRPVETRSFFWPARRTSLLAIIFFKTRSCCLLGGSVFLWWDAPRLRPRFVGSFRTWIHHYIVYSAESLSYYSGSGGSAFVSIGTPSPSQIAKIDSSPTTPILLSFSQTTTTTSSRSSRGRKGKRSTRRDEIHVPSNPPTHTISSLLTTITTITATLLLLPLLLLTSSILLRGSHHLVSTT